MQALDKEIVNADKQRNLKMSSTVVQQIWRKRAIEGLPKQTIQRKLKISEEDENS